MRSGAGFVLTATLLLGGCGSALVGDGAPEPTRSVIFGHGEDGVLVQGWLLVTQKKTGCEDIASALANEHDTGDAIFILMQRGPSLAWEGLYPGTLADDLNDDSVEVRHAEVYFRQEGDVAVLTGDDVWVQALAYDKGWFKAELDSGPAAGMVVADDCGAF